MITELKEGSLVCREFYILSHVCRLQKRLRTSGNTMQYRIFCEHGYFGAGGRIRNDSRSCEMVSIHIHVGSSKFSLRALPLLNGYKRPSAVSCFVEMKH